MHGSGVRLTSRLMPPNRQIVLHRRPRGPVSADDFRMETGETPALEDRQVLVRHRFLSLDPYMRPRMDGAETYITPQAVGAVVEGGTVGEIAESRHPRFRPGDPVVGMGGWQEYSVVSPDDGLLRKVDATMVPLSFHLGVLGIPGITAWYGLRHIIKPRAGETIVVSAASGAVGSAVGGLAKASGCRVVGIAGGPRKCRYVADELRFDACVDYKEHTRADSLADRLNEACPDGIHGYFENVGGMVTDAVLTTMNTFGRIAVCGLIAGYNGQPIPMAQPQAILAKRLRVQGFIITDHLDRWPDALDELGRLVRDENWRPRESVSVGLESAPTAFVELLAGRNFGKQLVRLD